MVGVILTITGIVIGGVVVARDPQGGPGLADRLRALTERSPGADHVLSYEDDDEES